MNAAEIIARKRDQAELSDSEIEWFIRGYTDGSVADYQMSALAMAIFLNGMTVSETTSLTQQMLDSGQRLQWFDDTGPKVDKHSTGGVGDKISIPLAPLLAACDLQVPMLSGRGLGPTGGTLDKLESISGFRTDLSIGELQQVVRDVGCVITGTTPELAPADRKLYALRDVTGTVPSIPLITASIMSKKLAESPDALVLDVKFGSGAFMKTRQRATELARSLVDTGKRFGVSTTALLTDMNQPMGRMCGNALEIQESIDVLQNSGPPDVRDLTVELCAELLVSTQRYDQLEAARQQAAMVLASGAAFEKFQQMIAAQGGDLNQPLRIADCADVHADRAGIVSKIDTERLGLLIIETGGGRKQLGDQIDHSVGLEILVRIGDRIERGQPLVRVFCKQPESFADRVLAAFELSDSAAALPLIVERVC